MKPNVKVSVCFISPASDTERTSVKTAYKDLCSQIIKFAEAIKLDPNIIIAHSVVSPDPNDLKACTYNVADPANPKIAELQTINKKISSGESSIDKPQQIIVEPMEEDAEPQDYDEDDPPRVKVIDWKKEYGSSSPVKVEATTPAAVTTSNNDIIITESILSKFGRVTDKTKKIVAFFVKNKDKNVNKTEIVKGTGLADIEISSWLAVSGKHIKALENAERGVYKLDSTKIKLKK